MNRIFGKPKEKPPPPSLTDASGRIDQRVSAIDEKIAKLEVELRKYKEQLKKARGPAQANIKRRAMEVVKRKRMYEQQRDQMAGQSFNIEQTSFAIESIKDTQTTVAAMTAAKSTMQAEAKKLDLDQIEDVQEDLADMLEDMNEINDMMGRSYGVPDELDETDLDAELACLEDELEGTGLEEEEGAPAYLQPSALPVEPSAVPAAPGAAAEMPAAADAMGNDAFGLPVAPTAQET